jgi:lysophospholipase L1-like esterase
MPFRLKGNGGRHFASRVVRPSCLGMSFVDYAAVMANPDGSPNSSLYRDGLHPNGAGYAAMWRALKPVLRSLGVETVD